MYYSDRFRFIFTQIVRMKLVKFTLALTLPFISYSIILVHCFALNTIFLSTNKFWTVSSSYTLMMTRDRLEARLWQKKKNIYIYIIHKKIQQDATVYQNFYFIFIWSSTCFGRHTAHDQEPKTALAASGFAYVEGCFTCSCWTFSASSNYTAINPPRMQNQRLLVQF